MNTSAQKENNPTDGKSGNASEQKPENKNCINTENNNSSQNSPIPAAKKEENPQENQNENGANAEMELSYNDDQGSPIKKLRLLNNNSKEKKDISKNSKKKELSKSSNKGSKKKSIKDNPDNFQVNDMLQKKRKHNNNYEPEKCYKTVVTLKPGYEDLDKLPRNYSSRTSRNINKSQFYAEYGNKANLLGSFDLLKYPFPAPKKSYRQNSPRNTKNLIRSNVKNKNSALNVNVPKKNEKRNDNKIAKSLFAKNENSKNNGNQNEYPTYLWIPTFKYTAKAFNDNEKESLMNNIKNVIDGKKEMEIVQYAIGDNGTDTYVYLEITVPINSEVIDVKEFKYSDNIPELTYLTNMMEFIFKCGTQCRYYSNIDSIVNNDNKKEKENKPELQEEEKENDTKVEKEKDPKDSKQEKVNNTQNIKEQKKKDQDDQDTKKNTPKVNQHAKENDPKEIRQEKVISSPGERPEERKEKEKVQDNQQTKENAPKVNKQENENDPKDIRPEKVLEIPENQKEKEKDIKNIQQKKAKKAIDIQIKQQEKDKKNENKNIDEKQYDEKAIIRKNIWIYAENLATDSTDIKEIIKDKYIIDKHFNWDNYRSEDIVIYELELHKDQLLNKDLYENLIKSSENVVKRWTRKNVKKGQSQYVFPVYTSFIVISNKELKSVKIPKLGKENELRKRFNDTLKYEPLTKKTFSKKLGNIIGQENISK